MNDIAEVRQVRAGDNAQRTLVVLALWFFIAIWLGLTGKLVASGGPPLGVGVAILLPVLVFVLDRRFGGALLGGLTKLDLPTLIRAQTFRIGGIFFIVAWLGGTLPSGFALPAGIGDIAVGLAAPFVAGAVARRRPRHLTAARIWNLLGVVDLVSAVSLGVMHSPSPLGLLAGPVSTAALARYPLSLIPTFAVPLALMLHICTFRLLATRTDRPDAG